MVSPTDAPATSADASAAAAHVPSPTSDSVDVGPAPGAGDGAAPAPSPTSAAHVDTDTDDAPVAPGGGRRFWESAGYSGARFSLPRSFAYLRSVGTFTPPLFGRLDSWPPPTFCFISFAVGCGSGLSWLMFVVAMVFRGGRPSRLSAFSPPPDFLSSPLRWRHGSLSSLYHPRVPGPPSARPAPVPTLRPSDSASVDLADSLHHTTVMRLPASASALIPSSAAAAAEETRLLLGRWAALIQEKGSRSELFVEASASADMAFHVQRVAAKFAPFTLQRYFDSWLNWVSFCRLSGADHLSPLPGGWAFSVPSAPVERRESLPLSLSFVVWVARILIRAVDRRRQKLYQCWALNFGARFYWARAAGLLASVEVLRLWLDLSQSGTAVRSLLRPPRLECTAFADACASASEAGVGGFVRIPDGRQLFFRQTFNCQELHELFPGFDASASAQSFIATWELLAQCARVVLLDSLLGVGHLPAHCVFKCDNSAADSASWKGLSMARGLCHILRSFLLCQQAHRISVYIDHVPGITNDVADALSWLRPILPRLCPGPAP
eukprot:s644_g18.t1